MAEAHLRPVPRQTRGDAKSAARPVQTRCSGGRHQASRGHHPEAASARRRRLGRGGSAGYIKNSVASLEEHLVIGSLLASFVWRRDWRSVLISSIAIHVHRHHFHADPRHGVPELDDLGLTLAVGPSSCWRTSAIDEK